MMTRKKGEEGLSRFCVLSRLLAALRLSALPRKEFAEGKTP